MEFQNRADFGSFGLGHPDFLSVDGLLSLRKSTSFLNLQNQSLIASNFQAMRETEAQLANELSDTNSCFTETESDDGYNFNSKRIKCDKSLVSLNSISYESMEGSSELSLRAETAQVTPKSVDGGANPFFGSAAPLLLAASTLGTSSSSSAGMLTSAVSVGDMSKFVGGYVPGTVTNRGKYKCRHCGAFKTNHVCAYVAESVLMCSQSTAMDPVMVVAIDNSLVIADKTLSVRKWQG